MKDAPLSAFVDSIFYVGPALVFEFENQTALIVDDGGQMRWVPTDSVKVDVRYDWTNHVWVDVNGVTDDAEEEPAPDGGEAVP